MQINFQIKHFNSTISKLIRNIYNKAHQHERILEQDLEDLHRAFIDYYENQRKDYKSYEASERANEVYSQFLQNLFDYCSHNIKDEQYNNELFGFILNYQNGYIFYKSFFDKKSPKVIIWINPKEGNNLMHSLCRGNYPEITKQVLRKLKTILSESEYRSFLNRKDTNGFSLLDSAAYFGNIDICKLLLEEAYVSFRNDSNGFNLFLNQTDKCEFTPLLSACNKGNSKVVELLLKVSIIYKLSLFYTILPIPSWEEIKQKMYAVSYSDFEATINQLRDMIRYETKNGFTPLIAACKHQKSDTLNEFLLAASIIYENDSSSYKQFFCFQNKHGFSALLTAVDVNSSEVVGRLLKEAYKIFGTEPLNLKKFLLLEERNGNSLLNIICKKGSLHIFNKLLSVIFTLGFADSLSQHYRQPLQLGNIKQSNNLEIEDEVKNLIQKREIEQIFLHQNKKGYSLLISACASGHQTIVKQLLILAVPYKTLLENMLFQENNDGYTPLITACDRGNIEVVKEILNILPDENRLFEKLLNQKNKFGFTAFAATCANGHLDIAILLVGTAIRLFNNKPHFLKNFLLQKNEYGYSPLISATKAGALETVNVLIKFAFHLYGYSNLFDEVSKYFQNDRSAEALDRLGNLLQSANTFGRDLNGLKNFLTQQNYQQYSALNTAACENFFDIVQLLLITARIVYKDDAPGFNYFLNQKNNFGFTPLNMAVKNHAKVIAEKLYAEGADPDIENILGFTARSNMPKDWDLFGPTMLFTSSENYTKFFTTNKPKTNRKRKFDESDIQTEDDKHKDNVGRYKITRRY